MSSILESLMHAGLSCRMGVLGIGSDIFISLLMCSSLYGWAEHDARKGGPRLCTSIVLEWCFSATLISLCIADASSFIERERIVPSQLLPILPPRVHTVIHHIFLWKKWVMSPTAVALFSLAGAHLSHFSKNVLSSPLNFSSVFFQRVQLNRKLSIDAV